MQKSIAEYRIWNFSFVFQDLYLFHDTIADQILVVDKGRIVQRGTHDALLAQDGIYLHFITDRTQAVSWKL